MKEQEYEEREAWGRMVTGQRNAWMVWNVDVDGRMFVCVCVDRWVGRLWDR